MLLKEILKYIVYNTLWLINFCIPKGEKTIMFIPHHNCFYDRYDLFNYKSDNVLCLLNNLLHDSHYHGYTFMVGYYHKNSLADYKKHADTFVEKNIRFVYVDSAFEFLIAFFKSRIIFTDEYVQRYPYKCSRQKSVCLNYFPAPFKEGLYISRFKDINSIISMVKSVNKSYDALVSVSDLASKLIAISCQFNYAHCHTLGFPRNDVFYQDNTRLRDRLTSLFGFEIKNIFLYVPTHRDYENPERVQFDKSIKRRLFLGAKDLVEITAINNILKANNSILIAKLHPIQLQYMKMEELGDRIVSYQDIDSKLTISLNEMMAISDCMITDYSSAVFDYFNANKPIIYHFYDIDMYNGTRGFTINPVESICAGEFTYTIEELKNSIVDVINGVDRHKDRRQVLSELFLTYRDDKSTERVKSTFLPV